MFIAAPVTLCVALGAMTMKYFASEEKTPSVLIAARRMLRFFYGFDRNCAWSQREHASQTVCGRLGRCCNGSQKDVDFVWTREAVS